LPDAERSHVESFGNEGLGELGLVWEKLHVNERFSRQQKILGSKAFYWVFF
jgi:hypothetical protein